MIPRHEQASPGSSRASGERGNAGEALLAREALKSSIVDAALDSVVTIDADGRVVEFNRAAERTFGHAREDVLGREMCELIIPPELRDAHRRGLAHAVATGENRLFGQRLELTGMRADGSRFPLELTITRTNDAGAPLFTGWLRDISERKRSDEEREPLLRSALLTDASELLSASLDYEHTGRRRASSGAALRRLVPGRHPRRRRLDQARRGRARRRRAREVCVGAQIALPDPA